MRDLIVAGGGPVGLATALFAAKAGLDVVVRERRQGVVDKACGEGLMPGALTLLAELGIDPPGSPLRGITYTDGGRSVTATFRNGPGRGVRRTVLHQALRQATVEAGIPIEHGPVRTVTLRADQVDADGDTARYLIAADGLHSTVRRRLGLQRATTITHPRYGLRTHAPLAPWSDCVEVHWSATSEAYVTPVNEHSVGIAVLSRRRAPLAAHLASLPSLTSRLGDVELSNTLGAGPLRQRTRRRVSGRALLVGDAAGYVDALTGEGIAAGLAQAKAAVAAVGGDDPESYEHAWRRLTRRHDALTHALVAATRPPLLRRQVVRTAAAMPWVFDAAIHQLAEPA